MFVFLGGLGFRGGFSDVANGAALQLDGQRVEAAQHARRLVDGDGYSYYITYTYTIAGQRYEREGRASRDEWERFCQGCPIAARHVSDDPATSRLETERPLLRGLLICAGAGIAALFGLWRCRAWLQERRRVQRIQRDGRLRLGTILDVTTREDSDNDLFVTLHYQLDGADAPQSLEWLDNSLRGRLPQSGARLAFAYTADDNLELL
jgi:hypothetical protein